MLAFLAKEIHANAKAKGFWDIPGEQFKLNSWCIHAQIQEKLLRIITEVAELAEGYRNGTHTTPCDKVPALSNEEEELADIFIRLLDFAEQREINMEQAVRIKMDFNATRPHLHGKEF